LAFQDQAIAKHEIQMPIPEQETNVKTNEKGWHSVFVAHGECVVTG
jgi:hypothetical protein